MTMRHSIRLVNWIIKIRQISVKIGLDIPEMLWNQSVSGVFEIYDISSEAIFNAMRIAYSLLLELDFDPRKC